MSTIEWRANNEQEKSRNTSEGCLFRLDGSGLHELSTTMIDPSSSTNSAPIQPQPGDDTSPPNSTTTLNGISLPMVASAGFSVSPFRSQVFPSRIDYEVQLKADNSLQVGACFEFENPHPNESMVVRVAMAKSIVHGDQELAVVATEFQEYIHGQWVDITAQIDYTTTADEVVQAVMTQDTGQTAGKATVSADSVKLTLGPFSQKARLIVTLQTESLYTYEAQSLDGLDIGGYRLLPLWVVLPFAETNHEGGLARLSLVLSAPAGAVIMPTNHDAYKHLKNQDHMKQTTILALSELEASATSSDVVSCSIQWECLPPRSCGVLAWLAMPNNQTGTDDDFVHVMNQLQVTTPPAPQAKLLVPSELRNLQVPLPGHGPMGSLWRLKVKAPNALPRQQGMFLLNLTLSDKSGSTGRSSTGNTTVRQRFNELAELRFLKRLESIPTLVEAGVLLPADVWMDVFLPFDHRAPNTSISKVTFTVADVMCSIVQLVHAIRNNDLATASNTQPNIVQYVQALRHTTPGGATDFAVGPETIAKEYEQWRREAAKPLACTFVEFDTDGGHNRGVGYLSSLENLCKVARIKNGVVTGFGAWLNQDCASRVARIFGQVPAQLALDIPDPGTEGLNQIFRKSFASWVSALRRPPPFKVMVAAGSVSYSSGRANGVEVLAIQRASESHDELPKFGLPDVSNENYTTTVLENVVANDELVVYLVSRLESASQLATALDIRFSADGSSVENKADVVPEAESLGVGFIAHDWLKLLTSGGGLVGNSKGKGVCLAPIMRTNLRTRLEDEVSFRFNIPSPSGSTSYLGRRRTVATRAPIDADHQPPAPFLPAFSSFGASPFGPPALGLFDSPSPSSFGSRAPAPGGIVGSPRGSATQGSFGASAPVTGTLFGSAPVQAAAFAGSAPARAGGFPGASAPALSFGPAPAPAGGAFGSSAPAPSFGSAPAPFGAAAPATSGFAGSAPTPSRAPTPNELPMWASAMNFPVGKTFAPAQNDMSLKQAMDDLIMAQRRIRMDPTVSFYCDNCKRMIAPHEDRFHCLDCDDFDSCANCVSQHTTKFHRLERVGSGSVNPNLTTREDPLVGQLLQPTQTVSKAVSQIESPERPRIDRTIVWCKLKLRRFLLAVLHWWPVFRATWACYSRLPESLPDDLKQKIVSCTRSDGPVEDLLSTATLIIDTLLREDSLYKQCQT